jgi:hypothetical protein
VSRQSASATRAASPGAKFFTKLRPYHAEGRWARKFGQSMRGPRGRRGEMGSGRIPASSREGKVLDEIATHSHVVHLSACERLKVSRPLAAASLERLPHRLASPVLDPHISTLHCTACTMYESGGGWSSRMSLARNVHLPHRLHALPCGRHRKDSAPQRLISLDRATKLR